MLLAFFFVASTEVINLQSAQVRAPDGSSGQAPLSDGIALLPHVYAAVPATSIRNGPADPESMIGFYLDLKAALPENGTGMPSRHVIPDPSAADELLSYFAGCGITMASPQGPFIYGMVGPVKCAEKTLHVQILSYEYLGRQYLVPGSTPALPASLAPYVGSLTDLDQFEEPISQAIKGPPGADPIAPVTMRGFYNESGLLSSGITGASTIGLTEICDPDETQSQYQTDLNSFDTHYGLPSTTIQFVSIGLGYPKTCYNATGWDSETDLDVQWAHESAPGAKIIVCMDYGDSYVLPPDPANCVQSFYNNLASTYVQFISNSWGGPSIGVDYDSLWYDLAASEVTIFTASGDAGSSSPSLPPVEPYGVAVGGTTITPNGNGYGSETTWNDGVHASGGGCSTTYYAESWQLSMHGYPGACEAGYRGYPDVSADADPSTGVEVFVNGQIQVWGGTSLASPMWAGWMDVIVQASGQPARFEAPEIYYLGESAKYSALFHDITTGNNGEYSAAPGWDPATGIGTPNVGALAAAFSLTPLAYEVGAQYTGDSFATEINFELQLPDGLPASSSTYAVLGGTYDNAGPQTWDSLGVDSNGGLWDIFYQFETTCGTGGVTSWVNTNLQPGQTYFFEIKISSGTASYSIAYASSPGTTIWSTSYSTKATEFSIANSAPCGPAWFPGWTDGEYVTPLMPIPPFDFLFSQSEFCTSSCYSIVIQDLTDFNSQYSPFRYPLLTYGTWPPFADIGGNASTPTVTIANEAYLVTDSSGGAVSVAKGYQVEVSGTVNLVDPSCSSPACTITMSASTQLSGLTLTITPHSSTLNFGFTLTASASSSASCGAGTVGIIASTNSVSPVEIGQATFTIVIIGCSGGCIEAGSPILTPQGYVPVQKLKVGQAILGYDFAEERLARETLVGNNASTVSSILDVNRGWLLLTLSDQPLYVLNATWVGWVQNPESLFVGEEIFNPVTVSWVPITNITVLAGSFTVYDVVTSGPNNFVDNGALLDIKR